MATTNTALQEATHIFVSPQDVADTPQQRRWEERQGLLTRDDEEDGGKETTDQPPIDLEKEVINGKDANFHRRARQTSSRREHPHPHPRNRSLSEESDNSFASQSSMSQGSHVSEKELLSSHHYDDDDATESKAKMPVKSMFVLYAVVFTSSLNITMLYPFLGPMMKDLGVAENSNEYGFYAGYIASAFMVGRTISSYVWGKWSDKHGRKPVCAFGSLTLAILSVAFGFNFSYAWVGIVRLLSGILNGVASTTKTIVSELCPESKQSQGMGYVSATRGLGLVIGPAIGGILSEPAEKYPQVFSPEGLFGTYKYLLPCLVCSCLAAIAYILCLLWLTETLDPEEQDANKEADTSNYGILNACLNTFTYVVLWLSGSAFEGRGRRSTSRSSSRTLSREDGSEDPGNIKENSQISVHKWASVQKIVAIYMVWSTVQAVCSEVIPLWCLAEYENGGLGLTTSTVGIMFAGVGTFLLTYQVFLFPRLSNYFGPIGLFRGASSLQIPLLLCLTLVAAIPSKKAVSFLSAL